MFGGAREKSIHYLINNNNQQTHLKRSSSKSRIK